MKPQNQQLHRIKCSAKSLHQTRKSRAHQELPFHGVEDGLEEIWKARDDHARRFGYDIKKICADLRRIEKQSGRRVVTRRPKRLSTTGGKRPRKA